MSIILVKKFIYGSCKSFHRESTYIDTFILKTVSTKKKGIYGGIFKVTFLTWFLVENNKKNSTYLGTF